MFTLDRLRFEHYVIMLLGLVNVTGAHLRGRDVMDSSISRHQGRSLPGGPGVRTP